MLPEVRVWAFFKDLKGFESGLPDGELPESERELINVIGFQPSSDERARPYLRSARMPPVLRPSRSLRGSTSALLNASRTRTSDAQPRYQRNVHAYHGQMAAPGMKEAPTNTWMWALSTPFPSHPG